MVLENRPVKMLTSIILILYDTLRYAWLFNPKNLIVSGGKGITPNLLQETQQYHRVSKSIIFC